MDLIQQLGSLSAHAYLVRAPRKEAVDALKGAIQQGTFGKVESADCFVREYETLTIDEVRDEITPFAYFKPVGERKFVVIGAGSILAPAQNALLKIVEEGSGKSVLNCPLFSRELKVTDKKISSTGEHSWKMEISVQ